ncbi:MAG: hypothetical protein HZC17_00090 [Candidatus Omnitrophica bacterium]|nr:hypothetical protein [Candidatus Omnitrophota bacterium]
MKPIMTQGLEGAETEGRKEGCAIDDLRNYLKGMKSAGKSEMRLLLREAVECCLIDRGEYLDLLECLEAGGMMLYMPFNALISCRYPHVRP